jgi:hypothetical protein
VKARKLAERQLRNRSFLIEEIDFPSYLQKPQGDIAGPLNRISKGILCGQLSVLGGLLLGETFPLTSQLCERKNYPAKKTLADRISDSNQVRQ